jgi:argininosuccinate lyase
MVGTMSVNADKMRAAAAGGFINATDLADYLVTKGMPFRTAYKLVGGIVAECTEEGLTLESLSLERYKKHSELFDEELYTAIDIDECVKRRISEGGPTEKSVFKQIEYVTERLK